MMSDSLMSSNDPDNISYGPTSFKPRESLNAPTDEENKINI